MATPRKRIPHGVGGSRASARASYERGERRETVERKRRATRPRPAQHVQHWREAGGIVSYAAATARGSGRHRFFCGRLVLTARPLLRARLPPPAPARRSGLLALVQEVQDAISGLVCYVFCQLRGGLGFAFKRVDTSNSMVFRSRPMRWSSLVQPCILAPKTCAPPPPVRWVPL